MVSGMDMLLKSFGVDPEQIKSAIERMGNGVVQVNERLSRIEAQQHEILRILKNGRNPEREATDPAIGDDDQKTYAGK